MRDLGAVDVARTLRELGRATFQQPGGVMITVVASAIPVVMSTVLTYRCDRCAAELAANVLDHNTGRAAEVTAWLVEHRHTVAHA